MPLKKRDRTLCALLSAALWWVSTLPLGLFALGWIAFVPFFYALGGQSCAARRRYGWMVGGLGYGLINWWIVPTVTHASPMIGIPGAFGFLLGILGVFLIALIQGAQLAVVALLWRIDNDAPVRWHLCKLRLPLPLLPVAVAVVWAALDALRCQTELAHGWGAPAFGQWRDTALLQTAGWAGQHGLSALLVWVSASFALWMHEGDLGRRSRGWQLPVAGLLLFHGVGAWQLAQPRPIGDMLHVLVVQTSISGEGKSLPAGGQGAVTALGQAMQLTLQGLRNGKDSGNYDLVVWPETTIAAGRLPAPGPGGHRGAAISAASSLELEVVARLCRQTGVPILCGANADTEEADDGQGGAGGLRNRGFGGGRTQRALLNAALLVDAGGRVQWSAKMRAVPFGERAPFGRWLPWLKVLAPQPEIAPAQQTNLLYLPRRGAPAVPLGAVICFESAFPYPARALGQGGARALFVLTNDLWFAGTEAPGEHVAMAAMRAVENGVPVVQSANGGRSAAIDRYGRFVVYRDDGIAATLQAWLPLAQ